MLLSSQYFFNKEFSLITLGEGFSPGDHGKSIAGKVEHINT